jgi:aminobenzoyl-glutamate utilization protein B
MSPLPPAKGAALKWIDQHEQHLTDLSDAVWQFAEPALREYRSARQHTSFLKQHGFEVQEGVAGMPTSFVGTYGQGSPVIGFYAEYDATPGCSQQPVTHRQPVTHGGAGFQDLHNGLGAASSGAAVAVKAAMESHDLSGTLKIFGTPAEKLCVGKPYQAKAGLYDDLDAAVCWHPWEYNTCMWDEGPQCYEASIFEFEGVPVYASIPWKGISALDAAILMNVMVNFLKEHIPREARATVNELITDGGQSPTIIPEYAQVWYVYRAARPDQIQQIRQFLRRAAEAAAMAVGASVQQRIAAATRPWLPNHALAETAYRNLLLVAPPRFTQADIDFARELQANIGLEPMDEPWDLEPKPPSSGAASFIGGADDVSEFSWHAPTCWIHVSYQYKTTGHSNAPSWATAALARTNVGHQCLLTAARAMALTAVDLLTDPQALASAKDEFAERTRDHRLPVQLPEDAEPPIDAKYSFPPFYPEDWRPPTGGL